MVHNIDSHRQLNTEQDSIKQVKGFSGLLSAISSNKNNVIIVPSNNKTFVTDLITKIHPIRNKYSIKLFGMQSWNDFENIDIDYFNSLELYYPTSQFIDFETERAKGFEVIHGKLPFDEFETDLSVLSNDCNQAFPNSYLKAWVL